MVYILNMIGAYWKSIRSRLYKWEVIIRYMLDTTIHSESFLLEEYENIPLLSVVPVVSDNGEG